MEKVYCDFFWALPGYGTKGAQRKKELKHGDCNICRNVGRTSKNS
jgi:hypothetical protein